MRPMSVATLPSESTPARDRHDSLARLQRGDGKVEMIFSAATGVTKLQRLYQKDPCRALFPTPLSNDLLTAVVATTSGGVTGGDRLSFSVSMRDRATAVVTTQAAEKVYRSLGDDCTVDIHLTGDRGTWLEWIPQETILFDQARLRRSTTIESEPESTIMAGDLLVFGRLAHREVFKNGYLRDSWQILKSGRLVWTDALRLDGDVSDVMTESAGFGGAVSMATFLYVADDASRQLEVARDLLSRCQVRHGASCVHGVLIVRFLSPRPQILRDAYGGFWSGFRAKVRGLPPNLPRVWHA